MGLIPLGILCFLFLLFPTGHLKSSRWRVAAWFVAWVFTIVTGFFLVFATMSVGRPLRPASPGGSPLWHCSCRCPCWRPSPCPSPRSSCGSGARPARSGCNCNGSQPVRRSSSCCSSRPSSSYRPRCGCVVQSLAFVFLFTTIAVAVLKYRLYDIDVVISKTVVYGSLAVFITVVYLAVVVGVGTAGRVDASNPFLTVGRRRGDRGRVPTRCASEPTARRTGSCTASARRRTRCCRSSPSGSSAATYSTEDVLPRMARDPGGRDRRGERRGLAARRRSELRPAASWPIGTSRSQSPCRSTATHLPAFADARRAFSGPLSGRAAGRARR